MGSVTLIDNESGKKWDFEVLEGTRGPKVIDFRNLFKETGYFSYDPGFTSTASCSSSISFL